MAKQLIANSHASVSVEHKARCMEGDFNGDWHDHEKDAIEDAKQHRKEPGCEDHVIKFITRQTSELLFMPGDKLE